ncbi:hypothetical protein [Ancylobacter polymorphus]|uniref:Oxidoreductase molybdopterin-binding domain-containing protein n=1 Tax=Ancylobacter polymorphus TaxID=223390 RepID=A0A9E7A5H0_9HYPH|nr:hypothetical protein [Ancylobacter polymorphus]UOK71059.1 hypothetical protein K9D25_20530 [Ancylobacter polymorphus]
MLPRPLRLGLVLLLLGASPANAADPVTLAGAGKEEALSVAALRALPAETLTVTYATAKGPERARFTGPRLWDLLVARGLVDTDPHRALLRSVIVVTAGDGYRLVLAAADLAPDLGDAPILLAHTREGEPLATARAPRLVVPGDRRGARQMFDVARIEVRVLDAPPSPPASTQENTP